MQVGQRRNKKKKSASPQKETIKGGVGGWRKIRYKNTNKIKEEAIMSIVYLTTDQPLKGYCMLVGSFKFL